MKGFRFGNKILSGRKGHLLKGVRLCCPCSFMKSILGFLLCFITWFRFFIFILRLRLYLEGEIFQVSIENTNKSNGFGKNQHRNVQEIQCLCWFWKPVGGEPRMEENQEVFVSWRLREGPRTEGDSDKQGGMLPSVQKGQLSWDPLLLVPSGMWVSLQMWSRIGFSSPTNLVSDHIIWFVCSSVGRWGWIGLLLATSWC